VDEEKAADSGGERVGRVTKRRLVMLGERGNGGRPDSVGGAAVRLEEAA
jgi:hypothetical protein